MTKAVKHGIGRGAVSLCWSATHHTGVPFLRRQYHFQRDEALSVSMQGNKSDEMRCQYSHRLTSLIFNASARYLAPSVSILLLLRRTLMIVCVECKGRWDHQSDGLTAFVFNASDRYLAPSSPIWLPSSCSVVSVCIECNGLIQRDR